MKLVNSPALLLPGPMLSVLLDYSLRNIDEWLLTGFITVWNKQRSMDVIFGSFRFQFPGSVPCSVNNQSVWNEHFLPIFSIWGQFTFVDVSRNMSGHFRQHETRPANFKITVRHPGNHGHGAASPTSTCRWRSQAWNHQLTDAGVRECVTSARVNIWRYWSWQWGMWATGPTGLYPGSAEKGLC